MPYVKGVKSGPYFSRFQVKYRRRREGKTDYTQRLALVTQDKNKYSTPKYRLVVRFTQKDVIAQIVYATLHGDVVLTAAYGHELERYGMKICNTNYATGYCVGLLVARRILKKLKMDQLYTGAEEATGEDFEVEEAEDGPRPFNCLLDIGLKRTTTGSKVFSVLKGALDGGISIPHSEKRFVGYNKEEKSLNAEVLRKYIFGLHIGEYMDSLEEEDADKYQRQFSQYIKNNIDSEGLEAMYKQVHQNIRLNPAEKKQEKKQYPTKKRWNHKKLTYDERRNKLRQKLSKLRQEEQQQEDDE